MSLFEKKEVKCPKCGNKFDNDVYSSVNVQSGDNKYRDLVLAKKINICKCEKCGTAIEIANTLLYHDMDNKFMVYYVPSEDILTVKNELNAVNGELNKQSEQLEYNYLRIVNNYDSLIEKILVAEAGLDDRVIELLKIIILAKTKDQQIKGVYFDSVKDNKFVFVVIDEKKPYCVALDEVSYKTIEEKLEVELQESKEWMIIDSNYAMEFIDKLS